MPALTDDVRIDELAGTRALRRGRSRLERRERQLGLRAWRHDWLSARRARPLAVEIASRHWHPLSRRLRLRSFVPPDCAGDASQGSGPLRRRNPSPTRDRCSRRLSAAASPPCRNARCSTSASRAPATLADAADTIRPTSVRSQRPSGALRIRRSVEDRAVEASCAQADDRAVDGAVLAAMQRLRRGARSACATELTVQYIYKGKKFNARCVCS